MSGDILRTKLHVPPLRPNLVPRPRLVDRLNQGIQLGHKLTLVTAPAGFGKSTLIGEWLAQLSAAHSGWLSLDDNDNDATRFVTYVVASLRSTPAKPSGDGSFGGAALALLQSPQSPPMESVLAALINEIDTNPGQFVVILDDYHVISSQAVHDVVDFLLDHLPPKMHLVILSRTDPPLPLARLRIRRELIELRLADLRFTGDETAALFHTVLGLDLSAEDVAALDARTEGWVAGLQVAALSMQRQEDVSGFIQTFTGSHRYIFDYLVEEVLDRQPDYIQDFLLRTAVLDRLSGPLCDAVTLKKNGQKILEQLERTNLFIVPLDDERHWYRYHHLFADLLRVRLEHVMPGRVAELHHRASAWHEKNRHLEDAVRHELAAEDYGRAGRLIEQLADVLWARGEPTTLLRWMESLPADHLLSTPRLSVHHAWTLFINGQNEEAELQLKAAEQALDALSVGSDGEGHHQSAKLGKTEILEQHGRIAAIRASVAFRQGDGSAVFRYATQAFDCLAENSLMWRCVTAIALGYAQDFSGDTRAAFETLTKAVEAAKASGNIYLMLSSGLHLGTILILQGKLKQAYALGQDLMRLARERGVLHTEMAGCLYDELGAVLCEWNEMDEAMRHLKAGSKLSRQGYDVGVLGYSYLTMLRALFAQGDRTAAKGIIEKMEQMERDSDVPPWYTSPKEAWKARFWLMEGDVDTAVAWTEERGLRAGVDLPYSREDEYIALARILVARHRLNEAVELLNRLLKQAESGGRTGTVIQLLIIQAIAYQAGDQVQEALLALEEALLLAEPGNYLRLFLDEGQPIAELLISMLSRDIAPGFVSRLLAAFAGEGGDDGPAASRPVTSQLVEPLSDRERTVLHLLAAGLSNREIAEELYVSINTVKAHAKNIYSKLGVHGRMQAVQRARELSLME